MTPCISVSSVPQASKISDFLQNEKAIVENTLPKCNESEGMNPDEDLSPQKHQSLEHCGETIPAENEPNRGWRWAQSSGTPHTQEHLSLPWEHALRLILIIQFKCWECSVSNKMIQIPELFQD